MVCWAGAAGCAFDSSLSDVSCDAEGSVSQNRLCQDGRWIQIPGADASLDVTDFQDIQLGDAALEDVTDPSDIFDPSDIADSSSEDIRDEPDIDAISDPDIFENPDAGDDLDVVDDADSSDDPDVSDAGDADAGDDPDVSDAGDADAGDDPDVSDAGDADAGDAGDADAGDDLDVIDDPDVGQNECVIACDGGLECLGDSCADGAGVCADDPTEGIICCSVGFDEFCLDECGLTTKETRCGVERTEDCGHCNPGYCSNGVKDADQGETDTDCGGPCEACATGKSCQNNEDCLSGNCAGPPASRTCKG